jgi:SAM-dependent methyltransferase
MLFQSHRTCPICNTPGTHWCKAQDWEYRHTPDYYFYLKCPSCNTLFLEELKEDNLLNIYPPNYYSFSQKSGSSIFKLKDMWDTRFYRSVLKKIPATNLSVLDIGGGTGQVLDTLKYADKRIIYTEIIDIDKNARVPAEKKGHVYTRSAIEAYHTEKKFEVILLLNIIEHVGSPAQLIEKAGSFLADNGIIIIKTPNADSLDARLFRKYYWGGLHCPRHWIIFTESSFRRMLSGKKLNIQNIKFTQGAAFWAYSLINLFRKKEIHLKKKPLIESPFFVPISIFFALVDTCISFFSPTSQMFIILRR